MRSSKRTRKVRQRPRISSPKLGEYLDVRAARRRETIVYDQKFPADFITSRYSDALTAIRHALVADAEVEKYLSDRSRVLGARLASSKYQEDTRSCCLEAVAVFRELWKDLGLENVARSPIRARAYGLLVEGVEVSVNPTVLLSRTTRKGEVQWGALHLVFRKEAALEEHGGQAAAEILRRALIVAGHTAVASDLCLVVDVFGMLKFSAPAHHSRLFADVEAACREIAIRWSSLEMKRSG
jgi:hypothetical protein